MRGCGAAAAAARRGGAHPLSVAPMMQVTDRHHRVMMRALTRRTLLYTEMVSAVAVLRGDLLARFPLDDWKALGGGPAGAPGREGSALGLGGRRRLPSRV